MNRFNYYMGLGILVCGVGFLIWSLNNVVAASHLPPGTVPAKSPTRGLLLGPILIAWGTISVLASRKRMRGVPAPDDSKRDNPPTME
jgi:hypothetical protein